jgi:hypothetical protein
MDFSRVVFVREAIEDICSTLVEDAVVSEAR